MINTLIEKFIETTRMFLNLFKRKNKKRVYTGNERADEICGFRYRCLNMDKKGCDIFVLKDCPMKKLRKEVK